MSKPMKMRCKAAYDDHTPWMYRIISTAFDGTQISFKTEKHNVVLVEEITPENQTVDAWVNVTHIAQQGEIVAITLPSPTIEFGKNINVQEFMLMPLGVTIEDFKKSF